MDYEVLYAELQGAEKELKDKVNAAQRLFKAIGKKTEAGDLKGMEKDLVSLGEAAHAEMEAISRLSEILSGFDSHAYFESGDFASQVLDLCRENEVDVKGEYPVFEMFPYRVKFDTENQDVYLDRKKIACMRPKSLVAVVKTGRDKLMRANFNEGSFANELAEAYDLALLKQGKQKGTDIYLTSIYKLLVPMSRSRKEYDQQNFAFDLARLYGSKLETVKDGRSFQFGPSRNNAKAIRILDTEGHEQYLATIRFF